jgi:hypothetical protein
MEKIIREHLGDRSTSNNRSWNCTEEIEKNGETTEVIFSLTNLNFSILYTCNH